MERVQRISSVSDLLEAATEAGDPPACACAALVDGELVHESAHGASPDGTPTRAHSVFDLASVTKAAATTAAVATLVARGALSLDTPVAERLPGFSQQGKERVTVRELLAHRSGLPAWRPLFVEVMHDAVAGECFAPDGAPDAAAWARGRAIVLDQVEAAPLEHPGERVYSDLGFLALGALIEATCGQRLNRFCEDALFAPLGLHEELGFVDLAAGASWIDDRHVLPTGRTRPREPAPGQEGLYPIPEQPERFDPGRVDDDNAFAMGGVAGHAGLFGTARAVASFGMALLEELDGSGGPLGLQETLHTLFTIDEAAKGPQRGLGLDVPSGESSSLGAILGRGPRGAFGHLGFTGCSLWLDLDRRLSVALLSNRTLPGRHRVDGIRTLRRSVHDALARAIDA
jgi:CubicO group peptidase (beta-lactamase class C family)